MNKDKIERMCRAAGMKPVRRERISGAEVFIADGFSATPHVTYARFGVEPYEFPGGCYATLWWLSRGEDKLDIGQPLFFELLHDSDQSHVGKRLARINAALKSARDFLAQRKRNLIHA